MGATHENRDSGDRNITVGATHDNRDSGDLNTDAMLGLSVPSDKTANRLA